MLNSQCVLRCIPGTGCSSSLYVFFSLPSKCRVLAQAPRSLFGTRKVRPGGGCRCYFRKLRPPPLPAPASSQGPKLLYVPSIINNTRDIISPSTRQAATTISDCVTVALGCITVCYVSLAIVLLRVSLEIELPFIVPRQISSLSGKVIGSDSCSAWSDHLVALRN